MWLTEKCIALGGEWMIRHAREHWALQALRAAHLFRRDEHYVIKEGKVLIVDENTGRALPGRTWEHGLHQIIERREACELSDQSHTVARVTYQRFFRRYLRLAGMTGTATEVRGELWADYGLSTVVIPTHSPCIRQIWQTRCAVDEEQKWQLCSESAASFILAGRPVLIGTRSVAASERLSSVLRQRGLAHGVLNAIQDLREAEMIAQAGQGAGITVATNMAGRGTDIKLSPEVRARGGLHVILTEFHESRRIDRQLFGRAARQGDPGSGQAIVALSDPLFERRASSWLPLFRRFACRGVHASAFVGEALRRITQPGAERHYRKVRKHAVREDDRLETSLSYAGKY
jgi:preprotein translocase subunit SecA